MEPPIESSYLKTNSTTGQPGRGRRLLYDMDDAFRNWIINFGKAGYVVRHCIKHQYVTILVVRHQKGAGFWICQARSVAVA